MKAISRTAQFRWDVRRMQRQGRDLARLKQVLESLVQGQELAVRHQDHVLVGQYIGTREYHLEPDWLLIYESTEDEIVLIRTGSHADLFT
jgi:mRNA interferase YafQ